VRARCETGAALVSLAVTALPPMPSAAEPFDLRQLSQGVNASAPERSYPRLGLVQDAAGGFAATTASCDATAGWVALELPFEPARDAREVLVQVVVRLAVPGRAADVLLDDATLELAAQPGPLGAGASCATPCDQDPARFAYRVREEGGVPFGAEQLSAVQALIGHAVQCRKPEPEALLSLGDEECAATMAGAHVTLPHLDAAGVAAVLATRTDEQLLEAFRWDEPAMRSAVSNGTRAVELVRELLPAFAASNILNVLATGRRASTYAYQLDPVDMDPLPPFDSDPVAVVAYYARYSTANRKREFDEPGSSCEAFSNLRGHMCALWAGIHHMHGCVILPFLRTHNGEASWEDEIGPSGALDGAQALTRMITTDNTIGLDKFWPFTLDGGVPCFESVLTIIGVLAARTDVSIDCSGPLQDFMAYTLLSYMLPNGGSGQQCLQSLMDADLASLEWRDPDESVEDTPPAGEPEEPDGEGDSDFPVVIVASSIVSAVVALGVSLAIVRWWMRRPREEKVWSVEAPPSTDSSSGTSKGTSAPILDISNVVSLSMWTSMASVPSTKAVYAQSVGDGSASELGATSTVVSVEQNWWWVQRLRSRGIPVLPAGLLKYSPTDLLGKGTFGKVYLADMSGVAVALKRVSLKKASDNLGVADMEVSLGEVLMLMRVSHPHLVRLLAVSMDPTDNDEMLLALEYCNSGNLDHALRNRPEVFKGQEQLCFDVLHDIAYGMSALHGVNIVHRDLKTANVMLCAEPSRLVAKVCDVGLARRTDQPVQEGSSSGQSGSLIYMSPQRILQREQATPACDVYAYGVVAYEVAHVLDRGTYRQPYSEYGVVDPKTLYETHKARLGLVLPEGFASGTTLGQLLRRTLIMDRPHERPTFLELHEEFCQMHSGDAGSSRSAGVSQKLRSGGTNSSPDHTATTSTPASSDGSDSLSKTA